jgi:D-alanyl-D-alanine carboxypeptidase (penicillin-binding protein 5/6)
VDNIKVNIFMGGNLVDKRIVTVILLPIFLFTFIAGAFAEEEFNINAKSAILIDYYTGEVIYEKNSNDKLPPASISKIMTLLLGMEALEGGKIELSDEVRISAHAAGMGGSQLWLEEGETQTVEDLFKAICLRSANDAAVALAEHISGSEESFVKMMNEKAKSLDMKNTNFVNSTGLPHKDHYVSAHDVALMSKELLKHKKIHDWLTVYMDEMKVGKKKDKIASLVNTNSLIKDYQGTTGIKTGSTNEAGFCLSASAKRGNLQLIAVVLGSETSKIRFEESMKLLDYGFANYDSIPVGRKGDVFGKVPVHKGNMEYIEAALERDSYILLPKGKGGNMEKEILLPEFVESPIQEGEAIGNLVVKIDGNEMDNIKLVSKTNVEKAGFKEMLKKTVKSLLINK